MPANNSVPKVVIIVNNSVRTHTHTHTHRLYTNDKRLNSEARDHLSVGKKGGVNLFPYEDAHTHLSQLVQGVEGRVWMSGRASYALCSLVPKAKRKDALSPLQLLKAVKNDTEIEGMKNAHVRAS